MYRRTKMAAGLGGFGGVGGGGVFHVNCDSVILLAFFISISPEVRILCESG